MKRIVFSALFILTLSQSVSVQATGLTLQARNEQIRAHTISNYLDQTHFLTASEVASLFSQLMQLDVNQDNDLAISQLSQALNREFIQFHDSERAHLYTKLGDAWIGKSLQHSREHGTHDRGSLTKAVKCFSRATDMKNSMGRNLLSGEQRKMALRKQSCADHALLALTGESSLEEKESKAYICHHLGKTYFDLFQLTQNGEHLEQALEFYKKVLSYSSDPSFLGWTSTEIGDLYCQFRAFATTDDERNYSDQKAIKYFEKGLRQKDGQDLWVVKGSHRAIYLAKVGNIYRLRGMKFEKPLQAQERAVKYLKAAVAVNTPQGDSVLSAEQKESVLQSLEEVNRTLAVLQSQAALTCSPAPDSTGS